jgi:hypothetical protein
MDKLDHRGRQDWTVPMVCKGQKVTRVKPAHKELKEIQGVPEHKEKKVTREI